MISNEYPLSKVIVFDSLRAAAPQGLLAIEAAKQLQAGLSLEQVVQYLTNARHRSGLIAALDTLDYLAQGGRIGKAAYLVGSAYRSTFLTINKEGGGGVKEGGAEKNVAPSGLYVIKIT
jgi:fatty acid-binding protein DegV